MAEKIRYIDEALGGITRMSFQMNVAGLAQKKKLHAIEPLGQSLAAKVNS